MCKFGLKPLCLFFFIHALKGVANENNIMTLTRIKNFINSPDHDRINFTFICIFYAQPFFNFKKSISRNELTFFKLEKACKSFWHDRINFKKALTKKFWTFFKLEPTVNAKYLCNFNLETTQIKSVRSVFNFKKGPFATWNTFFKLDPGQIFKIYGWIKLDPGHAEKNYPLRGTRPLVKLNKYAITSPSFPNVGLLAQRF